MSADRWWADESGPVECKPSRGWNVMGECRSCGKQRYLTAAFQCPTCRINEIAPRNDGDFDRAPLQDSVPIPVPASAPWADAVIAAWVDSRGRIWMEYGE